MNARLLVTTLVSLLAIPCRPAPAADDPEPVFTLAANAGGFIGSAQFSADGKKIFTDGVKPNFGIWDAKTGKVTRSLELPDSYVTGFSADGALGVGFAKNAMVVWDLDTGKQLVEMKGHTEIVLDARISADGKLVVSGSQDKTARVWEVKTGKLVTTLTGHKGPVASVGFNADGTRVATGSYFGEIKIWDVKTGKEQLDLKGMSTSNNPTRFSADDKHIVSPRMDSPAVWSAKDGKELQEFKGHKSWCRTAAFNSIGDKIVTAGLDKTARVWDVKTGKVLYTFNHDAEVRSAIFSPDGAQVLTISQGKARVWRLPSEK